jgi:hypothetical protein
MIVNDLSLSDIGQIGLPVEDLDRAVAFYATRSACDSYSSSLAWRSLAAAQSGSC